MIEPLASEPASDISAVWERLNDAFLEVYTAVLLNTATVKWQAHTFDNPYHHLVATATFERVGHCDDEDLIIDVGISRGDGFVRWKSDAGQSRGVVFADGPERSVPDTQPLASWMGEALAETLAWIREETPNFIAYLNGEPTPYELS